ncbi:dihydrodipicolinate synthase family protein [Candidatus Vidania fulgoroideorum]
MFFNIISVVTPMELSSGIDYIGLLNLFRFNLVSNNTHFLVNATTGESLSLGVLEKIFIIRFLRFYFGNFITLYCGSCFCSTMESLWFLGILNGEHIDFVLQITPYYFVANNQGILLHFTLLSQLSVHPLIIYNVPKRTALDISSACLVALLQLVNIFGIKDSSSSYLLNFERLNLCYLFNKCYLCGDDTQFFKLRDCEVQGLVSVFFSCFPFEFCKLFKGVRLSYLYFFRSLIFSFANFLNPVLIKYILSGFIYSYCYYRSPLVALDATQKHSVVLSTCFYRANMVLYKRLECYYFFNEFN